MLHTLATMPEHPESVPINALVRIKGTPLENNPKSRYMGYGAHDRNGKNTDAEATPWCV